MNTVLGLDAGGTRTRWALADGQGKVLDEGAVGGLTALLMGHEAGREQVRTVLAGLADSLASRHDVPAPAQMVLGITGYSDDETLRARLQTLVAELFRLPQKAVTILADVELACRTAFAPGAGYLVYAGTGSIGAFVDAVGIFHRVGGRGSVLGDPGSGHWIACEAMRGIWRREDEDPGCWRHSALAQSVFARVGGSDWTRSRDFIHQGTRGEVGTLALAVAAAADNDPLAREILQRAGTHLGQLALTLMRRFGSRQVVFAGRVMELHPLVSEAARATLPSGTAIRCETLLAHHGAAALAARAHNMQPPFHQPAQA